MTTERLSTYWRRAGQLFGFTVEAPYLVALPDGKLLTFSARLPDLGAEHGMLLSDNYESFSTHTVTLPR